MVQNCPTNIRIPCMRRNDGDPGLSPQELANILAPFLSGSGTVKQIVTANTGALIPVSTVLPQDDTIPQITEGDQILSLAITPTDATSRLAVFASANYGIVTATAAGGIALFRDAGPGALAAGKNRGDLTNPFNAEDIPVFADVLAGSTNLTTFTVRLGPNVPGTLDVNGDGASNRVFGGVSSTFIQITEYEP